MRTDSGAPQNDLDKEVFVFQNEIPRSSSYDTLSSVTKPLHQSNAIRKFWQDTVDDLKAIKWRRDLKRIGLHGATLASIGVLIWAIVILSRPWDISSMAFGACTPDGNFQIGGDDYSWSYHRQYNPWDQSSVFQINLPISVMDFASAKGVDIAWDFGFGRGVQGILTVVAYKVCTNSLTRLMETTPVGLRTFEAVTLQNDSITALCKIARDSITYGGLRAKLIISWILISTTILLFFQSLASAMTGYSARVSAYVQTDAGERVPANLFQAVQYVIHDGSRLGGEFYDDYPVVLVSYIGEDPNLRVYGVRATSMYPSRAYAVDNDCEEWAPQSYNWSTAEIEFAWKPNTRGVESFSPCMFMWHVSEYVSQYGFFGLNNTNSTLNNTGDIISLSAPSLNISANFGYSSATDKNVPWSMLPYGYYWQEPGGLHPFQEPNPAWTYQKGLYTLTEMNHLGTCQQKDVNNILYQWGFSSIILLMFAAMMLIWTIGTYAMYLDSYFNSTLILSGRDIGLKRAVLDIQSAIKKDLVADQVDQIGNSELRKIVKNDQLSYKKVARDFQVTRSKRIAMCWEDFDVKLWARSEVWWLTLSAIFFVLVFLSYFTVVGVGWMWMVSPLPWIGTVLVLIAGRRHKSRWILFAIFFIVFWGFNATRLVFWMRY